VALRPRLSPGVPLSWDVLEQGDATVRYASRQENLALTAPRAVEKIAAPWCLRVPWILDLEPNGSRRVGI